VHLSRSRVLSAAVIALLSLVACGSANNDAKPSATDAKPSATGAKPSAIDAKPSALDVITVGGTDKAPTLTFKTKPFTVTAPTTKVLTAGTGATVSTANFVTFKHAVFNGADGKEIESSFAKQPAGLDLSDPTVLPGLSSSLAGQQIGSRLLVAIPPDAGTNYTVVFLMDLLSASTPPAKTTAPR
jgi:peptidylprolyl isomerase